MHRTCLLLALGDSLTEGYGLPPGRAMPDVLQEMLRDAGLPVTCLNLGLSGDTSAGGLRRLRAWLARNAEKLQAHATGTAPIVAIVELGANDSFIGIEPDEVAANLDAILSLLAGHGIPALLMGWQATMADTPDYADDFEHLYADLAAKHGAPLYADTLAGIWGEDRMTLHDGLHPSIEGVRHMATSILPLVRTLVETALAGEDHATPPCPPRH